MSPDPEGSRAGGSGEDLGTSRQGPGRPLHRSLPEAGEDGPGSDGPEPHRDPQTVYREGEQLNRTLKQSLRAGFLLVECLVFPDELAPGAGVGVQALSLLRDLERGPGT